MAVEQRQTTKKERLVGYVRLTTEIARKPYKNIGGSVDRMDIGKYLCCLSNFGWLNNLWALSSGQSITFGGIAHINDSEIALYKADKELGVDFYSYGTVLVLTTKNYFLANYCVEKTVSLCLCSYRLFSLLFSVVAILLNEKNLFQRQVQYFTVLFRTISTFCGFFHFLWLVPFRLIDSIRFTPF